MLSQFDKRILNWIEEESAPTILINLPFGFDQFLAPHLGLHTLQRQVQPLNKVRILYLNLLFQKRYPQFARAIVEKGSDKLRQEIGIHLFMEKRNNPSFDLLFEWKKLGLSAGVLVEFLMDLKLWIEAFLKNLSEYQIQTIGLSLMTPQVNFGLYLGKQFKSLKKDKTVIFGGAACDGRMGESLAQYHNCVDIIFSGESENSFQKYLASEDSFEGKVIQGEPCEQLDDIALPSFEDFTFHLKQLYPKEYKSGNFYLLYETSRGCWWGAKSHCSFCGLTENQISVRERSASVALDHIKKLREKYNANHLMMADNILPYSYFKSLLPDLIQEKNKFNIFYEIKANLTFEKVRLLKEAGVTSVQPGIESFSTRLLKEMGKGVKGYQNIACLRYLSLFDIIPSWNLLFGFPLDTEPDYLEILEVVTKIQHFYPPNDFYHLGIVRFSPYFKNPSKFKIGEVESASEFIPHNKVNPADLAYNFNASYPSFSSQYPPLIRKIKKTVNSWQESWQVGNPATLLLTILNGECQIKDTRFSQDEELYKIDLDLAGALVTGNQDYLRKEEKFCLEKSLVLEIDDRLTPLPLFNNSLYDYFSKNL